MRPLRWINYIEIVHENNLNQGGVYKITNIINGRIYIGSTKNFKDRFYDHERKLDTQSHPNKFLQNDFNKCGTDNFIIEILKATTLEEQFIAEQVYIDQYYDNQEQCYNFKRQVIQEGRSCFSKTPIETSKILSDIMKKKWQDPYFYEKRIKQIKEIKKFRTPETNKKYLKLTLVEKILLNIILKIVLQDLAKNVVHIVKKLK